MAIHSRVHVPIKYGYLGIDDRKIICKSLFAKFKNTPPRVMYEQHLEESLLKDEIMEFQLNARELRNGESISFPPRFRRSKRGGVLMYLLQAFQQAVALARENSVYVSGGIRHPSNEIKLTLDELRRAFKVRQDYNEGINAINDKDFSVVAHERLELPPKSDAKKS